MSLSGWRAIWRPAEHDSNPCPVGPVVGDEPFVQVNPGTGTAPSVHPPLAITPLASTSGVPFPSRSVMVESVTPYDRRVSPVFHPEVVTSLPVAPVLVKL